MDVQGFLGKTVTVHVDRPRGSRHPQHGFVYPVNYGYVPGTLAPDGEPLDAYVLGASEPLQQFEGRCIAVIHRTDDRDDKLVVVPEGQAYTDGQIQALTEFQERFFTSVILRPIPEGAISRVTRSKEAAQASYDRISRWYDWLAGSELRFIRAGLARLGATAGERVLEVGCGTGRGLQALAQAVGDTGRAYGLDLSGGMLRLARSKARGAGLICGDGARLPIRGGALDALFLSFTLELFDTPELPLVGQECWRVLRRGGRLCVVALAKPAHPSLVVRLYEWAHRRLPRTVDCRPIFAREIVASAGFLVVEATEMSMWGLPVEVVMGRKP